MFTKFASYKVPPVMVSTHGSVVPLAMFILRPASRTSVVRCSCEKQFCFGCGREEHYTVPCLLVEGWENQAYHQDVKMKFMVILTKKCPKCKVDIEKEGGCQYMNCTKCRTEFCWHCLAICPRYT